MPAMDHRKLATFLRATDVWADELAGYHLYELAWVLRGMVDAFEGRRAPSSAGDYERYYLRGYKAVANL